MTILLIVIILINLIFLILDYRKFRRFIMNSSEREKLFTEEQMQEYVNKMDLDSEILKKYLEKEGYLNDNKTREDEDDF